MHTVGTKKWKFVGGKLCLDFTNSVGGRSDETNGNPLQYGVLKDKLENYSDLIDWGKEIGILNDASAKKLNLFASENERAAKKILQRAVALRESIYRIFVSIGEGIEPPREDINLLNYECAFAREKQKLYYDSQKFIWHFDMQQIDPGIMLWQAALSAAELLTSDQLHRVKLCPGENCGWLFLDTSKNGSRQWCDMKDCGNLAKVRRFREKKK